MIIDLISSNNQKNLGKSLESYEFLCFNLFNLFQSVRSHLITQEPRPTPYPATKCKICWKLCYDGRPCNTYIEADTRNCPNRPGVLE